MNESGRSVQPAMQFFHVAPRDVIVLHDELDLPFADVRVKLGGGHAGHNGLRSLVAAPRHARLHPRAHGRGTSAGRLRGEVADYLLSSFSAVERAHRSRDRRARACKRRCKVLTEGVERAMNEANTRPKRPGGEGGSGTGGSKGMSPSAAKKVRAKSSREA